jgi:hypothetical protein
MKITLVLITFLIFFQTTRASNISREYFQVGPLVFVDIKVKNSKNKTIHRTFNYFSLIQEDKKSEKDQLSCLDQFDKNGLISGSNFKNISTFINFNNRFFTTKYGVRVERSCLEGTTKEALEKDILESFEQGISCLKKLNGEGSSDLLKKINALFLSDSAPKIICSEKDISSKGISWDSAKAYASASSKFNYPAQGLIHPYISFGQEWRQSTSSYNFKSTLFHELLHNTGSIHNETVEYPYACQTCCFNTADDPTLQMSVLDSTIEQKKVACRICSTKYTGIEDKKYIKDIVEFSKNGQHQDKAFSALRNYMKLHPGDKFSLEQMVLLTKESSNEFHNELKSILSSEPNVIEKRSINYNLSQSLIYYSRGDFEKSAKYLSKVSSMPFFGSNNFTKNLKESLNKELFFMSLSNPRIKLSTHNSNSLDDIFKNSALKFKMNRVNDN